MTFTIIHLHVPVANLSMVLFLCPLWHLPSYIYMFLWPILAWFYSFVLYVIYHHTSTCSCGQSCHGSINNIAVLYVIYHHTSTCSCGQSFLGSIPFRLLQFCFLFSGSACQKSFVEAPVFCVVHTHVSECWGSLDPKQTVPWTDAVQPLERWWWYLCDLNRTWMTSF